MENLIKYINALDSKTRGIHFIVDDLYIPYCDFKILIQKNAQNLLNMGIKENTKVVMNMQPTLNHTVLFLSLMYIRGIPVSVKPLFGNLDEYNTYLIDLADQFDIQYFYEDLNPSTTKYISIKTDFSSSKAHVQTDSLKYDEDIAFIQFSSGSTSAPKAIEIKHKNIYHNINMIAEADYRVPESIGLNFLPLSHDMGLIGGLLSNLIYQNTFYLTSIDLFLRKLSYYLNLCKEKNIVTTGMPNFVFEYITKRLRNAKVVDETLLSSLTTIYSGAEPIRESTMRDFVDIAQKFGLRKSAIVFCYGLAETTLIVSSHRFETFEKSFDIGNSGEHTACVGKPVSNTSIVISEQKDGVGKILVSGKSVVEKLATIEIDEKKYLCTGDIGYIKNEQLYISGREKDMIIVNGDNVFLIDVENHIGKLLRKMLIADILPIVIANDDSFIVVLSGKKPIEAGLINEIVASIIKVFTIKPMQVVWLSQKKVLRTTSGKVRKEAILREIIETKLIT